MPPRGERGNCEASGDALHGSWNRSRRHQALLLRTSRIPCSRVRETDLAARRRRTQRNSRLSSSSGTRPPTPRTRGDQCRRNKSSRGPANGSARLERTTSCWNLRSTRRRDRPDRPHVDPGQLVEVLGQRGSAPETILELCKGRWNVHLENPGVKGGREKIGENRHGRNNRYSQTHQNAWNPQRPHWTASDEGSRRKTRRVRPVHRTLGVPRRNEGQSQGVPKLQTRGRTVRTIPRRDCNFAVDCCHAPSLQAPRRTHRVDHDQDIISSSMS